MNVSSKYKHPPITEALIDFRTSNTTHESESDALKFLSQANAGFEEFYPSREELHFFQGKINTVFPVDIETSTSQVGYKFNSANGKYVFQAAVKGFTLNRTAPYEGWESFRDEAKKLWQSYLTVAKPRVITRAAVRYINKIDLPLPFEDFREYLNTLPDISAEMPTALSGYLMQLQIPLSEIDAHLVLTQALVEPSREGVVTVLLDLDIFKDNLLIGLSSSEGKEWEILETLHEQVGTIFEACITDKTRELFD
jgi:uncharacterized protein (TIGR04255 family)